MIKTSEDTIILKVMNRTKKNEYTYTDVFIKLETIEEKSVMVIEISIHTDKKTAHLSDRTTVEKEVLNVFNIKPKIVKVIEKSVSGYFHIPFINFNKYVFADLVMNNEVFTRIVNIDEQKKATKKRTYIYFNHPSTGYLTGTITGKKMNSIIKKTDYKIATENLEFFPDSQPFVRISVSVAQNTKSVEIFQEMLKRLFSIYDEEFVQIVQDYKVYIPDFGDSNLQEDDDEEEDDDDGKEDDKGEKRKRRVKNVKLSEYAPDLFVSDYTRKCNQSRMPSIVSEEEALTLKEQGKDVMKFPRDPIKNGVVFPSDGENQHYYICNHKEHPYVGLKENKLSNSDIYPYTPCCFKAEQSEKDEFRRYYKGEEMAEPKPNKYDIIKTGKILKYNKFGTLPSNIESFFNMTDTSMTDNSKDANQNKYEYIRKGMFRNENSFIACVMEAFADETDLSKVEKDEDAMADYFNRIREQLNQPDLIACCRQEFYDLNTQEISEIILNLDIYFDPKLFVHLLEELYDCNIFIFSKKVVDGDLQLPRHLQSYYKNRKEKRSIFIFEHVGGETDNALFPQCELIVKKNTENPSDVKGVFSYDEAKNVIKLYSTIRESYALSKYIEEVVFPFENFQIESQVIDTYGKTRVLNILHNGKLLSLFVSPIQPIRVKETTEIYVYDYTYGDDVSIADTIGLKLDKTKTEAKGTIGNVSVSIMIKNHTNSVLETYNFNKKMARYLSEYTFWMFSKYLKDNNLHIENYNDIMRHIHDFSQTSFVIIDDYDYKHKGYISKLFSLTSPILQDEKIIVRNEETIRRLVYVLKLKVTRDPKSIYNYYDKLFIQDYYLELTDFDTFNNQKLLFGEESIQKLIDEYKKEYVLDNEIKIGNEPYFLKNPLIDDNVYIAQNANTIEKAVDIAMSWKRYNFNVGTQNADIPLQYYDNFNSFSLYSYINSNSIEKLNVVVNGKNPELVVVNTSKNTPTPNEHRLIYGYCVIRNNKNQCYMNSVVQLLFSIDALRDALSKVNIEQLKNEYGEMDGLNTIGALKTLFEVFEQNLNSDTIIDLDEIKFNNIPVYKILLGFFDEGSQEDSLVFLGLVLGKFDYFYKNDSIKMLLNSICHKQNTIVECTKDVFKTKEPQRHELSFSLQLSIDGKKPQQSLKELLENFQTYEIMNPSDKAKLSVCESEENPNGYFIKKKFDIVPLKTTEYFIISLKRYDENNRKIRNPVSDFKYIDIKGTLFLVVGCVVHMGDTGGGHYVYTVFKNGKIEYTLNDSVRTQMITENVISTDGFIFLYKRTTREQLNAIEDIKNHEDLLKHRKDFRDDVSPSLNADVKIVGYKIDGKSQFTTLIPI
jgi:ubiquitin C-terminal hydrolase